VLNGTITPRNPVGPFSGRIVVASNDPDARRTVVTLRGNVRPYLEHSPAGVSLRPNMHERGKVPLHVWNTDDRPISFSAHVIGVDAVLEPGRMTLQPQETGVVDISCPATVLQHQANRICLYTDHPEQRTVVIPISVEPVRGLMARPAEIRLGFVTRDEIPKQRYTLMIEGTLAPSARITDIVVPQFLTVASQKEDPATGVKEVAFAFSDADVHGVPEGEIAIHVALKDQPINETTVVVPVSGIVQ